MTLRHREPVHHGLRGRRCSRREDRQARQPRCILEVRCRRCARSLGLPLDLKPEAVGEVGDEVGITFAFARTFHPAMRFVGPIRAALGIPCVFNILGPLTNPANLAHVAIAAPTAR